jgi:4'-phosphopantetheinyl transferase
VTRVNTSGGEHTTHDPRELLALADPLALAPSTVHTWTFSLEGSSALVERCRNSLSPVERQRADRFVFPRDRVRHTIAHAVLRHLLGLYCDRPPESLEFKASPAGKPSLATPPGCEVALHFNLSHSADRALLGVSVGLELGVDLEKVRSDIEALAISRHYFFGSERDAIEGAPSAMRDNMFFRYWVAKEAVLKAQGVGLGFPLDRFRVDFLPGGHAARIETLEPERLERGWRVRMLPSDAGWLGAVAARGEDWDVKTEGPVVTDRPHL